MFVISIKLTMSENKSKQELKVTTLPQNTLSRNNCYPLFSSVLTIKKGENTIPTVKQIMTAKK